MVQGLIPAIPIEYEGDEKERGIFFFPKYEDMENALLNWLGERIDEWEEDRGEEYDEVALEVELSGLNMLSNVEYEVQVLEPISWDRVLRVLENI